MDENNLVEIGIVESDSDLAGKDIIGRDMPIADALAGSG